MGTIIGGHKEVKIPGMASHTNIVRNSMPTPDEKRHIGYLQGQQSLTIKTTGV
jgi:hypothetical protein